VGSSSAYCLLSGQYSTLGEITKASNKPRHDRNRPPLKVLDKVTCQVYEYREQIKRWEDLHKRGVTYLEVLTGQLKTVVTSRDMEKIREIREEIRRVSARLDRYTENISETVGQIKDLTG
jgi:hypothetical protein